jgi:hypothetical protein
MTLEELKTEILHLELDEISNFISLQKDEIKLLFSNLNINLPHTNYCIDLIRYLHANRNQGIAHEEIQFLVTSIAFYFKQANKPEFVQTCVGILKDNILKYRLQAWFQYKFEYRRTQSHITRFPSYLSKLSLAIADENEDYTDEVLSDLDIYYKEYCHISGFQEQFEDENLLKNFPLLSEFKNKNAALEYKIGLHETVDKIYTPSEFTEQLFNDKFINYIKLHKETVWHNVLMGLDAFTIRSEVIKFGQANFDNPYKTITSDEVVKLYCYFNMRKHYYSSLYLFERCSWLKKFLSKDGCLKFIDVGCGPATTGIALTDHLLTVKHENSKFDYFGVDYYKTMLVAASDFMENTVHQSCSANQFINSITDIKSENLKNANSIIINACYLFASPTLDITQLAKEINALLENYEKLPRFLLFQNTTDPLKNIKYEDFKTKIPRYDVLLSDKITVKYNNQRNSLYPPLHESVYFEVLKF